jgi:hypothetical protein
VLCLAGKPNSDDVIIGSTKITTVDKENTISAFSLSSKWQISVPVPYSAQ